MTYLRLWWFTTLSDICRLLGRPDPWRRKAGAIQAGLTRRRNSAARRESPT